MKPKPASASTSSNDLKAGGRPATHDLFTPTNYGEFVQMLFLHACRKVVFIETHVKIGLYVALVIFCSICKDLLPPIKTYMSNKHNVFNVYFVKWGWLWTLLLVVPFVVLTSYTYTCGTMELVRKHVIRVAVVATAIWFFCVRTFNYIEHITGSCYEGELFKDKLSCRNSGFVWLGFDISGHCFLLVFSNLVISEEVKAFKNWERIGEMLTKHDSKDESDSFVSPLRKLNRTQIDTLRSSYHVQTPRIKYLLVGLTFLSCMWEVMLLCTCLFFHSMPQKITGTIIAILFWFLTYQMWYKSSLSPGLPGDGLVLYWLFKQAKTSQPAARQTPLFKSSAFDKSATTSSSSSSASKADLNAGCSPGRYDKCEPRKKTFN